MHFKKRHHSLSEILKGIQQAVNSAQDMLQAQQLQNLSRFLTGSAGAPLSRKVTLGDRQTDVPLMALMPQCQLAMENVEVRFCAKVGDIATAELQGVKDGEVPHADLMVALEGVKLKDDSTMQFTIRFSRTQTPEGISRLLDEYNKQI